MTKEELIYNLEHDGYKSIEQHVNEFFESNVVIPKGTNRHPYADILHKWIEGADMQVPAKDSWYTMPNISESFLDYEYRIKPSEPVYEWQWITVDHLGVIDELGRWYTQEEFDAEEWQTQHYTFVKIEETKRERKV